MQAHTWKNYKSHDFANNNVNVFFFLYGATTQIQPWPPSTSSAPNAQKHPWCVFVVCPTGFSLYSCIECSLRQCLIFSSGPMIFWHKLQLVSSVLYILNFLCRCKFRNLKTWKRAEHSWFACVILLCISSSTPSVQSSTPPQKVFKSFDVILNDIVLYPY